MKENNIILDKTFALAPGIIKLYNHLRKNKVERDLCLQLLNCGTSVGANAEEAVGGSSRKDFIHKLEISYREARETRYWIRLLKESELLEQALADSLLQTSKKLLKS
jgi:four helix bundle protein